MDLIRMQTLLAMKFQGDQTRIARMAHFMGLIRTGVDGMASLGVVLRVEGDGLERGQPREERLPPDPLESLENAIAHMQRASAPPEVKYATHQERPEDQTINGQDLRAGEG